MHRNAGMPKEEIQVTPMAQEEAFAKHSFQGEWGCGVSKFDWEYSGKETAYVLEGHVIVTPTGAWSECKPAEVKAGDLAVFPDGMTCVWDVKEAIKKKYTFD